jgi:hypothetical protein
VRQDKRIDSDENLSKSELRDHVPSVIKVICELLESRTLPGVTNTLEGRVKIYLRIRRGYSGCDLVREFTLLRMELLDYLAAQTSDPSFQLTIDTYTRAARIINLYIDEQIRHVVSVYSSVSRESLESETPS